MMKPGKIIRTSIHSFFCSYHAFASLATILILPASAATLLSGTIIPSSNSSDLLQAVSHRLRSLFEAANFPANSRFFEVLGLKLSQTIFCFIFSLPFTLTFHSLAKASIVLAAREFPLRRHALPSFSSILHVYRPLLLTQLFTSFIILSANTAIFSMMFMAFSAADLLGLASRSSLLMLTAVGTVLYSTILACALVICNLASIVSAMENCSGYTAVLKACVLIRGRASVALSLALRTNLAMAAIEMLFQIRVMRPYHKASRFELSLLCEGITITYMYSILCVLDIIISCCFYKSCKYELLAKFEGRFGRVIELEPEEKCALKV